MKIWDEDPAITLFVGKVLLGSATKLTKPETVDKMGEYEK